MITVDHYSRRIKIAERAVALAKRIDQLVAAAAKLQEDARNGESAEIAATNGQGFSCGWGLLTSDFAVNSLARRFTSSTGRSARTNGRPGTKVAA